MNDIGTAKEYLSVLTMQAYDQAINELGKKIKKGIMLKYTYKIAVILASVLLGAVSAGLGYSDIFNNTASWMQKLYPLITPAMGISASALALITVTKEYLMGDKSMIMLIQFIIALALLAVNLKNRDSCAYVWRKKRQTTPTRMRKFY